jgi:hypothetical protein
MLGRFNLNQLAVSIWKPDIIERFHSLSRYFRNYIIHKGRLYKKFRVIGGEMFILELSCLEISQNMPTWATNLIGGESKNFEGTENCVSKF